MKRILIVDDDPSFSFELEQLFDDQFEVRKSVDGMTAISEIHSGEFDCIVLDIGILGQIDGLAVLQAIRGDKRLKKVPVIVLTNVGIQRKDEFLEAGATEYFVKGETDLGVLLQTVTKHANSIPVVQAGDN